jgi:methyltransferase-like protein
MRVLATLAGTSNITNTFHRLFLTDRLVCHYSVVSNIFRSFEVFIAVLANIRVLWDMTQLQNGI